MCSIFGYTDKGKQLHKMFFDSMRHRGPNAEGFIKVDKWTLGNQRLSIIDTSSRADQPMKISSDYLVYNGEIYNYVELRKKFLSGVKLRTTSDTEVLLRLLRKHGLKILNQLNGMFAFAWYNSVRRELVIVRDRFGVKPLHWMKLDNDLYFSSEIKPLIKIRKKLKFDRCIIDSFIKDTATDFDDHSFIEDIKLLQPGHYLKIDNNLNVISKRWYFFSDSGNKPEKKSYREYVDNFENLLVDAIKIRLRSDVPVCISLSGGVDSTVIYTLIKERLGRSIQPVTFIHPGKETSEQEKAERLVKDYGDKLITVQDESDCSVKYLKKVLNYLEFPIWNNSAVAYYSIYKKIHDLGYKVVIEGHGGDELLGGYPFMIDLARRDLFCSGKFIKSHEIYKVYEDTLNKELGQKPQSHYKGFWEYFVKNWYIFTYENKLKFQGEESAHGIFERTLRDNFEKKIIPIVLRTFDRLTMANSVESRCPYLDYRVVELSRGLPLEVKVNKIGNKAILREILKKYGKDYIFKDKVKMGFATDVPEFYNKNKKRVTDLIQKYNDPGNIDMKNEAIEKLMKEKVGWQDVPVIWKVFSLQLTKEMYDISEW